MLTKLGNFYRESKKCNVSAKTTKFFSSVTVEPQCGLWQLLTFSHIKEKNGPDSLSSHFVMCMYCPNQASCTYKLCHVPVQTYMLLSAILALNKICQLVNLFVPLNGAKCTRPHHKHISMLILYSFTNLLLWISNNNMGPHLLLIKIEDKSNAT